MNEKKLEESFFDVGLPFSSRLIIFSPESNFFLLDGPCYI